MCCCYGSFALRDPSICGETIRRESTTTALKINITTLFFYPPLIMWFFSCWRQGEMGYRPLISPLSFLPAISPFALSLDVQGVIHSGGLPSAIHPLCAACASANIGGESTLSCPKNSEWIGDEGIDWWEEVWIFFVGKTCQQGALSLTAARELVLKFN